MSNRNSNLPSGCRESDIPGNRPEDVLFDKWWDNMDGYWEDYLTDEVQEEDEEEILGSISLRKKYSDSTEAYEGCEGFKKYADNIYENMQDPDYGRPDRYEED